MRRYWNCERGPGQAFTDDPLGARSTVVKTVDLTQLRQRIDELRVGYGLSALGWTDGAGGGGYGKRVAGGGHARDLV